MDGPGLNAGTNSYPTQENLGINEINKSIKHYPQLTSNYSGVPNSRTYQNRWTLGKNCPKSNRRTPVLHYLLQQIIEPPGIFSHCVNSQTRLTIRDTGVMKCTCCTTCYTTIDKTWLMVANNIQMHILDRKYTSVTYFCPNNMSNHCDLVCIKSASVNSLRPSDTYMRQ